MWRCNDHFLFTTHITQKAASSQCDNFFFGDPLPNDYWANDLMHPEPDLPYCGKMALCQGKHAWMEDFFLVYIYIFNKLQSKPYVNQFQFIYLVHYKFSPDCTLAMIWKFDNAGFEINACPWQAEITSCKLFLDLTCPMGKLTK